MNVIIRKAETSDIPQILDLYAELQPLDTLIEESMARSVFEQANKCGVTYFVADIDGRIAGTCYIAIIPNITRQCSPIGFIENVVTSGDYRRLGIGRKLMDSAVEFARECDCYKVTLQSGIKREEAHKFYESVGFDGDSKRGFEIRLK
ncbi:MAG: GNAT family N-acetyltransferase [Oscillospiraceae bacterium]|nr:GNAT family N-acetyltransferase [Oscillospiraceae bacterium]